MKYFAIILFSILFYSGCTECVTPTTTPPSTTLQREVLQTIAKDVIFASYEEMLASAERLQAALAHLDNVRTPEALDSARAAWRSSISTWMLTQAYLFGPVKYKQIDALIGTWPINPTDIDELVKGGTVFSPDELHFKGGSVKGLHTIEYLIFGDSLNKEVNQITNREYQYLDALAETLVRDIGLLVSLWSPDEGNFTGNFASAGKEGSDYPSMKDAFDELIGNFLFITDVVGSRRIFDAEFGNPQGSIPNPIVLESRFSKNTNHDYADIIRSIKNIYLGGYNTEGKGLTVLVVKVDKALDESIRLHLDEAISAIEQMKPWIGVAMFNDRVKLTNARLAIGAVEGDIEAVAAIVVK